MSGSVTTAAASSGGTGRIRGDEILSPPSGDSTRAAKVSFKIYHFNFNHVNLLRFSLLESILIFFFGGGCCCCGRNRGRWMYGRCSVASVSNGEKSKVKKITKKSEAKRRKIHSSAKKDLMFPAMIQRI